MNVHAPGRYLVAALLAVVCLNSGCTPASPATPGPSGSPAATPIAAEMTPWQQEMANLAPDGTRSLESALALFVMAFGPLPGVNGARAAEGTVDSASPAVAAIYAHWDELTPEQQQAVEGHLAVPDDVKTLEVPVLPATSPEPLGAQPAQPAQPRSDRSIAMVGGGAILAEPRPYTNLEQELLEEAARVRARAAYYFGDIPELVIQLPFDPNEPYLTFFNPTAGTTGVDRCQVAVNNANANDNRFQTRRALTLDIVHCLQSHAMGNESGFEGQVPPWAWDGPAQYIAFELWPQEVADAMAWVTYLQGTDISLFARSYDAVGYYAQAFWNGISLINVFKAVLTDVDNPERFALAGTASSPFLDTWASGLSRRAEFGLAWDFSGPQILSPASAPAPITNIRVSIGSTEAFSQAAYTNHLFAVSSSADIMIVEAFGRVRLSDGDVDQVILGNASFCTTDKGCGPCPDGSDPTIEQVRLVGDSLMAVSGGTDGTNGTIHGHALEEFCLPTPSPSSSPDDEFCRRWQALLDWMLPYVDTDYELSQPWADEIRTKSKYMREVAPPEMLPHVDVYIQAYGTYADAPDPANIPLAGPYAAQLGTAFYTIYNYCLSQASPPPTPPPTPTPQPTPPPAASPTPAP